MRRNAIFWGWAALLAIFLVFATQPVGLHAQFTFGLFGVATMLAIRLVKARGFAMHIFMAIAAAIVFRYMWWRATDTLPPVSDPVNFFFGALLFAAELYSVSMLVLSFFIVSDPVERADAPLRGAEETWPTVDVFVPSYNEDLDIVGQTLAAAKNLDYPASRLNVYLLDDGGTDQKCFDADPRKAAAARERRAQFSSFCRELGVHYLTRARNEHAKAGNLNAGLAHSSGDLVVVFDADHAPTRDFLRHTVGHFQRDPKLFLVQTPHFFLNPDPVEKNLETFHRMPSENEMFYSVIQKGLDKWNGTFFCGSAAVLRREALMLTNGFSGQSITEDAETALELHSKGWNSVYVDRAMIAGLQPETFASFIGQRARWCQGMLQILMLKRPFLRRGLTPSQRLAYTSSPLFWLFPLSRLVFMIAPALYVFFDLQIYDAGLKEFIAYTLFFLVSNVLVQNQIYGRVRWPWISELYEYVQSLYLVKSIASVVVNPRAPSFNVTAKGETLDESHLSPLAWPYFAMFGFLAATTGYALWRISFEGTGNELLLIVTLWSVFNLAIGAVALGTVAERRERRRHYRMDVAQRGELQIGERTWPVTVDDCSIGGMRLRPNGTAVPFQQLSHGAGTLRLAMQDGGQGYPLDVRVRWTDADERGPSAGLEFAGLSAMDRRVVSLLMYRDHNALEAVRKRRHTGRTVSIGTGEFVWWAAKHTARAFAYAMNDLRQARASRRRDAQRAAAIPTVAAPSVAPAMADLTGAHAPVADPAALDGSVLARAG